MKSTRDIASASPLRANRSLASRLALPLVLLGLIALGLGAGCTRREVTTESQRHPIERVVLISIDTLRADFVGCYDDSVTWTPSLDALAAESVVFTDAMAQAPTTTPSHKSILYSVYPHVHQTFAWSVPEESIESPIEALRQQGLRTAAFVGGGQLGRNHGFRRGFDDFWQNEHGGDRAEKRHIVPLEAAATAWLDEHHAKPFFLFLHTYQTHCPYVPPEPYREAHTAWYAGALDARDSCGKDFESRDLDEPDTRYVRSLYAAEVAYVDAYIGRLVARLKELGIYDETMIVFLSDHGEALGEGDRYGHGRFSEWELRVPLIAKIPGVEPRRIDAPVELLDVMPTVYSAVDAEPPFTFQGHDLFPAMGEPATVDRDRVRVAEKRAFAAIRRGPWRLVHHLNGGTKHSGLFHVEADPDGLDDRSADHPDIVEALLDEYTAVREKSAPLATQFVLDGDDRPMLDETTRHQLEVLGYIR